MSISPPPGAAPIVGILRIGISILGDKIGGFGVAKRIDSCRPFEELPKSLLRVKAPRSGPRFLINTIDPREKWISILLRRLTAILDLDPVEKIDRDPGSRSC